MNEIRRWTVAELAEMAFHARERVRALEMMNTPTDFDERKKAFVELAEARAEMVEANRALAARTTEPATAT